MKQNIKLLITDLDNTLWDWFEAWQMAFTGLLEELVEITGLSKSEVEAAIRRVHQNRGASEYLLLVEELTIVQELFDDETTRSQLEAVIQTHWETLATHTRPYPLVVETLTRIKAGGTRIVAYTESHAFWAEARLRMLGLDGIINHVYASPDIETNVVSNIPALQTILADRPTLKTTTIRYSPEGLLKPDPFVLKLILQEEGISASETAYVGDSVMKDVLLGQQVGVNDIHAAYGEAHHRDDYNKLRGVSHWTDEMINKVYSSPPEKVPTPTHTLRNNFGEIFNLFNFTQ